jgi:hypothetical protein
LGSQLWGLELQSGHRPRAPTSFEKVKLILACKLHSSIKMVCKKIFKHCIYAYVKHAMSFSNFETCFGDETNDTKLTTKPHLIPPPLPQRCVSLLNVKTKFKLWNI